MKKPIVDSWADIGDLRKWVGRYLTAADARHGGRINQFVSEGVNADGQKVLATYMQG